VAGWSRQSRAKAVFVPVRRVAPTSANPGRARINVTIVGTIPVAPETYSYHHFPEPDTSLTLSRPSLYGISGAQRYLRERVGKGGRVMVRKTVLANRYSGCASGLCRAEPREAWRGIPNLATGRMVCEVGSREPPAAPLRADILL